MKIHEIFCENPRIFFVLFYDVHKENMFTINLEDGREASYKASIIKQDIRIYICCLYIAGQTAGPIGLKLFVDTHG